MAIQRNLGFLEFYVSLLINAAVQQMLYSVVIKGALSRIFSISLNSYQIIYICVAANLKIMTHFFKQFIMEPTVAQVAAQDKQCYAVHDWFVALFVLSGDEAAATQPTQPTQQHPTPAVWVKGQNS